VHDDANKQDDGEVGMALLGPGMPAGLEHHREDEGVDHQHEQRIEQGPEHAHDRAAIAGDDLAPGHLQDERAVPQQCGHHEARRDGRGSVWIQRWEVRNEERLPDGTTGSGSGLIIIRECPGSWSGTYAPTSAGVTSVTHGGPRPDCPWLRGMAMDERRAAAGAFPRILRP